MRFKPIALAFSAVVAVSLAAPSLAQPRTPAREITQVKGDLYRARNATNRLWLAAAPSDHPLARSPVFLAGDSAMGSPYFQSISLGFECAMLLASLVAQRDLPLPELLDRYELYLYKQWLRVYMRSKMIKHNKDLLESVGDTSALLKKLHIY